MRSWKTLVLLAVTVGLAPCTAWRSLAQAPGIEPDLDAIANRLIKAYPDFLERREGNALVWRDGKRMAIDDGRGPKTPATRLQAPDIKDMFVQPYPFGPVPPPALDDDPGRARYDPLFIGMYGDCSRNDVRANLESVVWLPKKWGKTLEVTRVNGVSAKLAAVSAELDALPARFDTYLFPPAGTYNCRPIAGTSRQSPHGFGIAIDIAIKHTDYWRWTKPGADGRYDYKNRIPAEIVAIFEKHGFIWGGKWYHYDTMHFEYRPELLSGR